MKKALFPAALALVSGIALAQVPTFEEMDANQDGVLSQEEAAAFGLDLNLTVTDTNQDGVLSKEEYEAAVGGGAEPEGAKPAE